MTFLCVPLTGSTCQEMAAQIGAARQAGADMIELRLDYLQSWDSESIRELMSIARQFSGPIIATCRIAAEGGYYDGDESQRVSLMEHAGLGEADYIDVEYAAWRTSANLRQKVGLVCDVNSDSTRTRRKLILSQHDFTTTPLQLESLFAKLAGEPAHVVKLACKAESILDSLRMLSALRASAETRPTIALSMGETGLITRVLARKLGAFLTFASLQAGKESAPGQPTLADLRSLYRWNAMKASTLVYGVIGCPVAHSMSPAIHNAAFAAVDHGGVYLPFRVEPALGDLTAFLDGCLSRPWLDLRGCSVTIPHKENLLRYAGQRRGFIEPLAQRIGVANTLCIEPGQREDGADSRISVYNTDYCGALDALCQGMSVARDALSGTAVAVLGAGGVSRAIVAGLADCGARITIYNRTIEKARLLATEFGAEARPISDAGAIEADVIINCTSIGMWPHVDESPLPENALKPGRAVFDTVYNPIETRLLREARECSCRTIDGVAMFVNQAAEQFRLWTGKPAPVDLMRAVTVERLRRA